MKRLLLIPALALLSLTTISFAATPVTPPDPAAVKRGLPLYENNCQRCHQAQGVGENIPDGIRNPDFRQAIPLNEKAHAWHHLDDQLVEIIGKGNSRMPPFKQILSEDELRDVIAYMKSLWSERILNCQGPKHMNCP